MLIYKLPALLAGTPPLPVALPDRLELPTHNGPHASSSTIGPSLAAGAARVPRFDSARGPGAVVPEANGGEKHSNAAHSGALLTSSSATGLLPGSTMSLGGSEPYQNLMSNGFSGIGSIGGQIGGVKKGGGGPGAQLGGFGGPGRGLGPGPGGLPDVADAALLMHMSDLRPPTPDTLALFRAPTPEVGFSGRCMAVPLSVCTSASTVYAGHTLLELAAPKL